MEPALTRDPTHDILDAAAELAAHGGFDEVRLRDVAAKAGVALATLYKRFPSKEAALGLYNDPDYQEAKRIRQASTRNISMVLVYEFPAMSA